MDMRREGGRRKSYIGNYGAVFRRNSPLRRKKIARFWEFRIAEMRIWKGWVYKRARGPRRRRRNGASRTTSGTKPTQRNTQHTQRHTYRHEWRAQHQLNSAATEFDYSMKSAFGNRYTNNYNTSTHTEREREWENRHSLMHTFPIRASNTINLKINQDIKRY